MSRIASEENRNSIGHNTRRRKERSPFLDSQTSKSNFENNGPRNLVLYLFSSNTTYFNDFLQFFSLWFTITLFFMAYDQVYSIFWIGKKMTNAHCSEAKISSKMSGSQCVKRISFIGLGITEFKR